jgi:hypothetical protein
MALGSRTEADADGRRPFARRRASTGARCLLLAVGLGAVSVAGAQGPVTPELRAEAARLFRDLAAIRGLPRPGPPPPLVIQSREDRRRFVARELARKSSPARLEAERRALAAWHLVPAGFDLAGFLADLLAEQAAAYYDPVGKRIVLANWLTPELRRDALAHELVHALQDRLVGLDGFLTGPPGHSDEGLARQALVEGEAVALQHEIVLRREGRELARLPDVGELQRAIRASVTGPVVARAPRYVRTVLTFPYAGGVGFIHAVRQRRPWSALTAIYRDPPRSSAQILHPERYLDERRDPLRIELADLTAVLPPGSRQVIEEELGELGLGETLHPLQGERAGAPGWRGDRYAVWDLPGGASLLVAVTAWDTGEVAADFARAYAGVLAARPGLGPQRGDGALVAWFDASRASAIERRGRAVLILEGAPPAILDSLRTAAWAAPMLY